jgi:hypothetical protein
MSQTSTRSSVVYRYCIPRMASWLARLAPELQLGELYSVNWIVQIHLHFHKLLESNSARDSKEVCSQRLSQGTRCFRGDKSPGVSTLHPNPRKRAQPYRAARLHLSRSQIFVLARGMPLVTDMLPWRPRHHVYHRGYRIKHNGARTALLGTAQRSFGAEITMRSSLQLSVFCVVCGE